MLDKNKTGQMGRVALSMGYVKYIFGGWQYNGVDIIHPFLAGMASFICIKYWRETGTCSGQSLRLNQ